MSLAQLQKIRERRLEKQQTVVQQCKQAFEQAQHQLAHAHHELVNFKQWRLQEQEKLFKSLQQQSNSLQGLNEYQTKLEVLRQREQSLQEAIPVAQKALEQAQATLQQAVQEVRAMAMKNEKTKEIVSTQDKAERQLALYNEENQDP